MFYMYKYINNQENQMQQVIRVQLEYRLEIQEYQSMNYIKKRILNKKKQKENSNYYFVYFAL